MGDEKLTLELPDPAELAALNSWLAMARIRADVIPGTPVPGEQGAVDILEVLVGSGGLIAAVQVLPDFLRARRPGIKIRARYRDHEFVIEGRNADEVLPVLKQLIDDDHA